MREYYGQEESLDFQHAQDVSSFFTAVLGRFYWRVRATTSPTVGMEQLWFHQLELGGKAKSDV